MEKNEVFTAEIDGVSSEGMGVARFEGRAVFVKGALPGERCEIKVTKVGKQACYGRLVRVLEPSSGRIKPPCPHYGRCGGCKLLHASYEEELRIKRRRVDDAMARIGGLELRAGELIGAKERTHYRNKAVYVISRVDGKAVTGFYRERSHDVVPVERCLLQSETADAAAAALRQWMDANGIPHYEEETGKGLLRHLFVRSSAYTGEAMVCLVSAGRPPHLDALVELLRACSGQIASVVLNLNTKPGNVILGEQFETLWGADKLTECLCGLQFSLSPASFFQVNVCQAEKLYEKAVQYCGIEPGCKVIDLYCGTGTIGLCAAAKGADLTGVEVVEAAVRDAEENARRNGIEQARFLCADAAQATALLRQEGTRPDAVIVDPPRKGLSEQAVGQVAAMQPWRIVYVSCDPATLARDLKRFAALGYHAEALTAVDMFPATAHVECVVLMSRVSK